MILLHEKIDVPRPAYEAFAYVRDFRNTPEWDSTAKSAVKLSPGPVDIGTRFALVCALPLGSITLYYTVTHMEPGRSLELHGHCRLFEVTDTIHFSDTTGGTHIDYRAQFNFNLPLGPFRKALAGGMKRMGYDSLQGLQRALEDRNPSPERLAATARADRWIVPGVAMFSRHGYRRGRRRWYPMSAWMGGKHVVITGASSGLGLAAARALAERGASLTLVLRDERKALELVHRLHRETGNNAIFVETADLSLMSEVDLLIERLRRKDRAIDVLINNAGALFNPWGETPERIEQTFALLLLGPYRLTEGLFSLLARAPQGRVVNVVSGGMYTRSLQVDRLQPTREGYSGSDAYARAKRALMVLTEQWAEAWADHGIVVNAMHPGWADTPGVASALPGFYKLTRSILRSPEQGADTMVWLAVATEAGKASGKLFLDREPRSTHLLASTVDDERERSRLQPFLRCFRAPPRHSPQRPGSGGDISGPG